MKRLTILIPALLLIGCARKTYTDSESRSSAQSTSFTTAVKEASSITADKSIIVKTRQYDTSLYISGSTLTGSIDLKSSKNKTYENEDLSLFITVDTFGVVNATAVQKSKPIRVKLTESTTSYNDIHKTELTQLNTKVKTQAKTDSLSKTETKEVEPVLSNNFLRKGVVIIVIVLVLAAFTLYLRRKVASV